MPWQSLAESREQYSLRWETKYLMELGEAFDYILNGAISMATQEALKYTIISGNSQKMESFFCNSMHVKKKFRIWFWIKYDLSEKKSMH